MSLLAVEPTPAPDFTLPARLEAHEPPEARGLPRDGVRLLVARAGCPLVHARFRALPAHLRPGDLLVVNTSATLPAALEVVGADGRRLPVHLSTELADGHWLVEPRARVADDGERLTLPGGGTLALLERRSARLWVAAVDVPLALPDYLARHGRPIRYRYVPGSWPISAYQTVFATEPGSAEMPSAGRPFTTDLVTALVAGGVLVAPILLHTGVASPEAGEAPYPERFAVPRATARLVNLVRATGGRVVAVGTTVVRALETVADEEGLARPGHGWTDLVITPDRGLRLVDGLITGFHEPRASHLRMLAALVGPGLLGGIYAAALAGGYLWHEFGDSNLLLP